MCQLCKNNQFRNYTHARSTFHKKNLIKYFKKIKSGEINSKEFNSIIVKNAD